MSSAASKRAKRKAYFRSANPSKKKKDVELTRGMKGFICTCNGNVKGCIREALNILDDFDSKLNGKSITDDVKAIDEEEEDIERTLKREIITEQNQEKKFKPVETGMENCIFISSRVDNTVEIAEAVMKEVEETRMAKSRHLIRLVPVEVTCKAYNEDIKKAADGIFDKHFKEEPTSYCIHINKRNNNNLLRKEVTDDLARLVRDRNLNHKVDLKTPIKTVVVEIIRNICCLSVVNNFFGFRKYNLIELASKKSDDELDKACKANSSEIKQTEEGSLGNSCSGGTPDDQVSNSKQVDGSSEHSLNAYEGSNDTDKANIQKLVTEKENKVNN